VAKNFFDFVLDCAITMSWCFEDERNDYADEILETFGHRSATVPTIWPLEVANVLLMAKKNNRVTEIQSASFIDAIASLPIVIDQSTTSRAMHSIFSLAGQLNLTIYDAAYLELAIREKIPLLTLDKKLMKAAKKLEITLNPHI
jgi:predicted nucleic acid-binding protein